MPSKSDPDWVRSKERIPYHGKGVKDLVGALQQVLSEPANKYAQKIILEVGTPYIYLEKLVPAAEAGPEITPITLHDAIRTNKMDEYEADEDLTATQQLWEIFNLVHQEGLEVCAVAAGDKLAFQKWLGVRIPQSNMSVFGTPFFVLGELPADAFVVCGASTKIADNEDIKYSMKGSV